jgi:hypothetical protein
MELDYRYRFCMPIVSICHPESMRRYLQQLIDTEVESAKASGTFEKGVLFLKGEVKEVESNTVWRHPQPDQGEVSCLSLHACCRLLRNNDSRNSCFPVCAEFQPEALALRHTVCGASLQLVEQCITF